MLFLSSLTNRNSKMIECFICSFNFGNPQKLCEHLKSTHGVSGENDYTCMKCETSHTKLWKFRRHLDLCYADVTITAKCVSSKPTSPEGVARHQDDDQQHVLNFESNTRKIALEFVCKLAGNMNIPRNYVFEVLEYFQSFYRTMITEGFSKFIMPHVCNEQQINVIYLKKLLQDPFRLVKSEYKLDSELTTAKLISPLKQIEPIEPASSEEMHSKRKSSKKKCSGTDSKEFQPEKEKVTLMPLEFQFQKFFELPDVFELTQKYAEEVSGQTLSHFVNGMHWKKKLESYHEDDIVIPYHLHIDDVQLNNSLGSHRVKGLETCTYYSFPTVPSQFNSRLENIFVAQLFSSNANKHFGNLGCFTNMIDELNTFAEEGVTLNINGEEKKVINLRIILYNIASICRGVV